MSVRAWQCRLLNRGLAPGGRRCRIILAALAVMVSMVGAPAAEAQRQLFVTNQRGETVSQDAVIVYTLGATGTLSLERILRGPSTRLKEPTGIAVFDDAVLVANQGAFANPGESSDGQGDLGFVTIHRRSASGDEPPTRVIRGTQTGLNRPFGLAVTDDELFVANQTDTPGAGSITVYKLADVLDPLKPPDVKPVRTLAGGSTQLDGPGFILVTATELFVANNFGGTVTAYPRNVDGNVSPGAIIKNTEDNPFVFPAGLAFAGPPAQAGGVGSQLYLAHGFVLQPSAVSVYRRDSPTLFTFTPPALKGDQTHLDVPSGVALTDDFLVVANTATLNAAGSITVYGLAGGLGNRAPSSSQPGGQDLFSPVALALVAPLKYTLTNSGDVTVKPGRSGATTIRATLNVTPGTGTATFLTSSVSGLPAGATASFDRSACEAAPACEVVLTIATAATTPQGVFPITVTARDCQGEACSVDASTSFTLRVAEIIGTLRVQKSGSGQCTVTSTPAGIDCRLDQTDCAADFLVPSVTLTAQPDASSRLTGWQADSCGPQLSCPVAIVAGTTTTVGVVCDLIAPNVTAETTGRGKGTITSEPPGIACPPDCAGTFPIGGTVTLTARPAGDSSFGGWSGCSPTANPLVCTVVTTEATHVVATFIGPRVTVVKDGGGSGTVTSQPSGIDCGPTCSATFDSETEVRLTAVTGSDSRFVGWQGCTSTSGPACTIRPSTPQTTITATFAAAAAVTVTNVSRGGGGTVTSVERGIDDTQPISCGSACSKRFGVNTTVTLQAAPVGDSIFAGWARPDCAGFDSPGRAQVQCAVSVPASGTGVTALFVGTLPQAFVARLYLRVLRDVPTLDNLNELVASLQAAPLLLAPALVDAFFDGPVFRDRFRSALDDAAYGTLVFRAVLWRQPDDRELAGFVQFLQGRRAQGASAEDADRDARRAVMESAEFASLIRSAFGITGP